MDKKIKRRDPKVYCAGPITSSGSYVENVREGIRFGNALLNDGFIPFVPHLSELWNLVCLVPWDEWMRFDKEWLRACDALYRLPGKSKGAAREVRFANKLGIPVFTSYRKLTKWRDEVFLTGRKSIIPRVTKSSPSRRAAKGRSSRGSDTKKSA